MDDVVSEMNKEVFRDSNNQADDMRKHYSAIVEAIEEY
jgi:hypothetical protein